MINMLLSIFWEACAQGGHCGVGAEAVDRAVAFGGPRGMTGPDGQPVQGHGPYGSTGQLLGAMGCAASSYIRPTALWRPWCAPAQRKGA
jgi:hypothetical protein